MLQAKTFRHAREAWFPGNSYYMCYFVPSLKKDSLPQPVKRRNQDKLSLVLFITMHM